MKVYLASDHVGFEIKNKLKVFLESKNYQVIDCGPEIFDKDDDYPDFIGKAAEGVSKDPQSRGVIFGGSGQGEAIVANKYKNVRCALFYSAAVPIQPADITGRISDDPLEMIRLTRDHNDANMLSIGVRFVKEEEIMKIVLMWLEEPFSDVTRHKRRIAKINRIEEVCMK